MKKKTMFLTAVVTAGMLAGAQYVAFGRVVPGYDKPYDPANYYSLTSISYADSAPSPFALKDLKRNGGKVYDYIRHLKAKLLGEKDEKVKETKEKETKAKQEDMSPWTGHSMSKRGQELLAMLNSQNAKHTDKSGNKINNGNIKDTGINGVIQDILQIFKRNHKDNVTKVDAAKEDSGVMHAPTVFEQEYGRDYNKFSLAKRDDYLSRKNMELAMAAQGIAYDQVSLLTASQLALQQSNSAPGTVRALMANTNAKALNAAAATANSDLMTKLSQVRYLKKMKEQDDYYRHQEFLSYTHHYVANPYDKSTYATLKRQGWEPYKTIGMPDFK